jgi:hypothetical protein
MKTIKTLYAIFGLAIISLFTANCSDLLDQVSLDTSIAVSEITIDKLPLLVRGMYSRLHNNSNIYGQSAFGEEIASDNFTSSYALSAVSNFTNFDDCKVSVDDQLICGRMFSYPYNGIGAANIIINFVNSNGYKDNVSLKAKGESLVLRGYCYMLLAERFGDVVITLGDKSEEIIRTQQPEEEVWKQAENDFLEAQNCLGNYNTPNEASLQAAQALLARLYLNRGVLSANTQMIADAERYANQIITGNSLLNLNEDFNDNFISTSSGNEVIYRLVETVSTAIESYQYGLLSPESFNGNPSGSTFMEESLKQLYNEPEDERVKTVHTEIYPITSQEATYCTKFPADKNPVWPIIRLSEMYLIVAEAKARRGAIDVTEFNILRNKRNASLKEDIDFKDTATFLDEIENERRRELAAEGLRWMDMRRFNSIE